MTKRRFQESHVDFAAAAPWANLFVAKWISPPSDVYSRVSPPHVSLSNIFLRTRGHLISDELVNEAKAAVLLFSGWGAEKNLGLFFQISA